MGRPGRRPGMDGPREPELGPGAPPVLGREREARRPLTTVNVRALYDPEKQRTPEQLVDHFARLLLIAPLSADQRAELVAYVKQPADDPEARIKGLLHLIMSTPNYQLC
jgi:hypothetical protein